jgi:cell division protease FtsH
MHTMQTPKNPFTGGRGPNALILLCILASAFGFLIWYNSITKERETISYSDFVTQVEKNNVKSVLMADQHVQGSFVNPLPLKLDGRIKNASHFEATIIPTEKLLEKMHEHNVAIDVHPQDRSTWFSYFFFIFLFSLFIIGFYIFSRQNQGGGGGPGGKIFNVGKSRARFFMPNTIKTKFADVAGVDEAKEDLKDVVDFLKNPEKYKKMGAKIPRGVLLTGAPGNGKTMLAKAVAGEASVPFFSVSGSDFVEVFVGVGASRVRDLFAQARRHAPCIVFIDEIDAVGRQRGAGVGGGNDEREQTLNQLLAEMDGFSSKDGEVIVVIAATNRKDVLDKALLRPGRFDRKVEVPYPDLVSREGILKIHAAGVKLGPDVDLHKIARGTARFSGADLENLINEAALIASKNNALVITMNDFEFARDKILVGAERKTLTRTSDELRRTAYHEAGHTMMIVLSKLAHPLHKVTILSRGGALGITWYLPEGDQTSMSEEQIRSEIMVCLGGRLAEEIMYGAASRTTGASNDFQNASRLAHDMVCTYGMSRLGPVIYNETEGGYRQYSEDTARKIDEEQARIIEECFKEAKTLLEANKDKLTTLAEELLKKETLDALEVYALLGIEPRVTHRLSSDKNDE